MKKKYLVYCFGILFLLTYMFIQKNSNTKAEWNMEKMYISKENDLAFVEDGEYISISMGKPIYSVHDKIITYTILNLTDKELNVGTSQLEVYIDGIWYWVPFVEGINGGYTNLLYILNPNSSIERSQYLEFLDLLPGKYRFFLSFFVKEDENVKISPDTKIEWFYKECIFEIH